MDEKKVSRDQVLLKNIKATLPELEELYKKVSDHWAYEDGVYRFYHGSFKVYHLQDYTVQIIEKLKTLAPEGTEFDSDLGEILSEGTGKKFSSDHNDEWNKHTRPIVEAFFHAKFFLEMAVKYGKELEEAPNCLPSGWAALLYFYKMRYG